MTNSTNEPRSMVHVAGYSKRFAVKVPDEAQALGWGAGIEYAARYENGALLLVKGGTEGQSDSTRTIHNRTLYAPIARKVMEQSGWGKGTVLMLTATPTQLELREVSGMGHAQGNLFDSWLSIQQAAGYNKTQAMAELDRRLDESVPRGGNALYDWRTGRRAAPASVINCMISDVLTELVNEGDELDALNIHIALDAIRLPGKRKSTQ